MDHCIRKAIFTGYKRQAHHVGHKRYRAKRNPPRAFVAQWFSNLSAQKESPGVLLKLASKIRIPKVEDGAGTPLRYSCLESPTDGGVWQATVPGVAKSRTQLNDFTFTFHFHALEKAMATHSSVLAWRIPGTGEPGGLPSMGSHRVGHD